MRGRFFTPIKK
jgi:hypothetical protein